MLLRRLSLLLLILLAMLVSSAAPALGWANGSDGGDGYGTHDWVIHEANRLSVLQGCEWANMALAQPASDDPDTVFSDVIHHVYDVWGPSTYGDAPARIGLLYQEAVRKLRAGDAAGASRSVGLLSHYYADICNPLHTDQAPEEDAIHASYEDDVEALTDTVGENRAWAGIRRLPARCGTPPTKPRVPPRGPMPTTHSCCRTMPPMATTTPWMSSPGGR